MAFCLWALLAFTSWHYESTCGVFFASGCLSEYWRGIRWVVLLKWVSPYQTLIGGGAALIAGLIVLKSTRETIESSRKMKALDLELDEVRYNAHMSKILQLVSVEFYILCGKFMSRFSDKRGFSTEWLSAYGSDIVEYDPELWEISRKAETLINHLMGTPNGLTGRASIMDQCALLAFAAHQVLNQSALEEDDADPPARLGYFDATEVISFMEDRNLGRDKLLDLQRYFDWSA